MPRKGSNQARPAKRPFMVMLSPEHQRALKTVAAELGFKRTDAFRAVIVNVAAEMFKQKQSQTVGAANEQPTAA